MTFQSPSKYTSWDLTEFSQLPSADLLYFPESNQWSEISLSKVILVVEKTEVAGSQIRELSHLSDLMFCPKTLHEM